MSEKMRRTKIVCTLGPATDSPEVLEKLLLAGANMVRLNFSHGKAEDHARRADTVRQIARKLGLYVAIMGDLQGPKIRVSTFKEGAALLQLGDVFTLDASLPAGAGDAKAVGIDYKELPGDVQPGDILLLDDGRVRLKVRQVEGPRIIGSVLMGGKLSNNKGINKLGGGLSAPTLTDKDKDDILTAAKIGVDYLAVSFPRTGADLALARELALTAGCKAKIVAKVERAEAVASDEAMDDIILASDAVMVARGDLGVEIGDPELVGVQKKLIRHANRLDRAVITATQMMESMIVNSAPTRAEVMDVANAVLDGTDAVMLSAETATGKFPVETVSIMAEICRGAEKMPSLNVSRHRMNRRFSGVEESTAMAAMYQANHLDGITAIMALTESGHTALLMSRITSGLPIFALSRHESTLRRVALFRGVTPISFISEAEGVEASQQGLNLLREKGHVQSGDMVIITQGEPMGVVGNTNTCRLLRVF